MICKVELNPKVTVEREPVQGGFKIYIIKKEIVIMKKIKKNNKGFSLVELIVVVLIMAIIAVALAPQVMKWVGNARTSSNVQSYDTMVEYCNLALGDETTWNKVNNKTVVVTIDKDGTTCDNTDFEAGLNTINADWKNVKVTDENTYKITITNGNVARTTEPTKTMN